MKMKHYQIKLMDETLRDHFLEAIRNFNGGFRPIPYQKKSVFFMAENEAVAKHLVNFSGAEMVKKYGFYDTLVAGSFLLQEISSKKYKKGLDAIIDKQKEETETDLKIRNMYIKKTVYTNKYLYILNYICIDLISDLMYIISVTLNAVLIFVWRY